MSDAQAEALARGDILPEPPAPVDSSAPPAPAPDQKAEGPPSSTAETPDEQDGGAVFTEEAEADEKEAAADDKGAKEHRIPKSRFDQAVNKERQRAEQAERELEKFRARERQRAEAANFEESQKKIKELLKQHSSLLADGDLDKASDVMEQVLQLRDDMNTARAQALAESTRHSTKNELRYDATVDRLEAEYPVIDPQADEFDEDVVRNVQALMTGIMQTEGLNPADALLKATEVLLKPLKDAKGAALREQPSPAAIETGLRRTQAQIDKNVKAAAAQPPSSQTLGKDHDATGGLPSAAALKTMSFEEFSKVPDSELAKLRGDYL